MKFNLKMTIAILLALTIIGFSVGTVILISNPGSVVFGQRGISLGTLGRPETKTATIDLGIQSTITIVNSVGELIVDIHDGDKIEVVYEAFERSVLETNVVSNAIKIEGKITPRGSINNINTSVNPVKLTVLLPKTFNQSLTITNGVGKTILKVGEYLDFEAKTGVGEMEITPLAITSGSFGAEVGVGSLKIILPEGLDAKLTANAGLGNVSNRFTFDSEENNRRFVSHSFTGTVGQGSATITLKVGTGDISIR